MKNVVFWDVTPCGFCKQPKQAVKNTKLVDSYHFFPTSPILVALMMVAICSFETSVLTQSKRHNIPEDGILHL
jgi:hypothetical protein